MGDHEFQMVMAELQNLREAHEKGCPQMQEIQALKTRIRSLESKELAIKGNLVGFKLGVISTFSLLALSAIYLVILLLDKIGLHELGQHIEKGL